MAYLRRAVGHRHLRAYRIGCERCESTTYVFERHCPHCGTRNGGFDSGIFEALARCPIDDVYQLCRNGDHFVEGMREFDASTVAFCTICGGELPRGLEPPEPD